MSGAYPAYMLDANKKCDTPCFCILQDGATGCLSCSILLLKIYIVQYGSVHTTIRGSIFRSIWMDVASRTNGAHCSQWVPVFSVCKQKHTFAQFRSTSSEELNCHSKCGHSLTDSKTDLQVQKKRKMDICLSCWKNGPWQKFTLPHVLGTDERSPRTVWKLKQMETKGAHRL